ncbi:MULTISPECIES: hydroxymethylpyrimidine/phosphomethylpyrimidine kinase [unclassified Myroides]|uniref:hydroxymethylpyrimidine/phosphomethylpyrimidine kinase n=1 Tax=unclassified Myroides TaxID=2642485 RepID=UPI003D2F60FF
MLQTRPIAFSIAGFDPCGGAGLLADIKTFENHQVYAMGILTANTTQTEDRFVAMHWEKRDCILTQLEALLQQYIPKVIKVGIIQSGEDLLLYLELIKQYAPHAFIIWDPVLRSSTQFDFSQGMSPKTLYTILQQIDLLTPNYLEIDRLSTSAISPIEKAKELSQQCAILLKGGHAPKSKAVDQLVIERTVHSFPPTRVYQTTKHGTGCVLSSAIGSYIALGYSLPQAIQAAKKYIEKIINSNSTLLAYHV